MRATGVHQARDARMREAGEDAPFALEPHRMARRGQRPGRQLDRDLALVAPVGAAREPHAPHAAGAELAHHGPGADLAADEILDGEGLGRERERLQEALGRAALGPAELEHAGMQSRVVAFQRVDHTAALRCVLVVLERRPRRERAAPDGPVVGAGGGSIHGEGVFRYRTHAVNVPGDTIVQTS